MNHWRPGMVKEIRFDQRDCLVLVEADYLYPGGGGQPNDQGLLRQGAVTVALHKTREMDGHIYWVIQETSLHLGGVDIQRDDLLHLEYSQQHSSQHIFSGLALQQYGWKSDGFTIFTESSKIEFVGADLDLAKYEWLEQQTNQVIMQGIPIHIVEATKEDALRKVDNPDHTRVVSIEGIDKCCCSGTHVSSTDQIGGFAILQVERKNKESVRVIFGAGLRLARIAKYYKSWEHALKNKLKGDIEERTDVLLRENDLFREKEKELMQIIADIVPAKDPIFKRQGISLGLDSLKYLALGISQKGITAFLSNKEGYFVLSGPLADVLFDELKQGGAKGGGKGIITGKLS